MLTKELILLGLLKEGPKHGYEIKLKIKEILSLFAGIELKSIYYPLKILEKKGIVQKHTTKHGKRPQRYIYKLTPKGESRFEELLNKSFLDFKRPQFSLDLSLYFLQFIDSDSAQRRLKGRIFILNKIAKGLSHMLKTQDAEPRSSLNLMLEHNLKMVEAEAQFLESLIKTL